MQSKVYTTKEHFSKYKKELLGKKSLLLELGEEAPI